MMPLIQLREGLLEQDNFYLTSSFSDFLGNGTFSRKDGACELKQGEIKRNFTYKEFVIDVVKECKPLKAEEKWLFFVELIHLETDELQKIGIEESQDASSKYWRIIGHDNFMQVYSSGDGITWINAGGHKLINQEVRYQGFSVEGETSLVFTDYKVYQKPFVTLQNFEEGYKVELYSSKNDLIKTRLFDQDMVANLFLDYNLEGYFKVYDLQNQLIYTSSADTIEMGSLYSYTPYELEMTYRGEVIAYGPTHLKDTLQMLQLKNIGSEPCNRLRLIPFDASRKTDTIELSLDGITYMNKVVIETLEVQQVQDIYVRITKENEYDFEVHSFEIKIY